MRSLNLSIYPYIKGDYYICECKQCYMCLMVYDFKYLYM